MKKRNWLLAIGMLLVITGLVGQLGVVHNVMAQMGSYEKSTDSFIIKIALIPVALFFLLLLLSSLFGYPAGTALILLVGVKWFSKKYLPPDENIKNHACAPVFFPLLGNLYIAIQSLIFLPIPSGTAIRPMAWTALMFLVSIAISIRCLAFVINYMLQNKKIVLGVIGILLSLLPVFTATLAFHFVANIRGLMLAP